MSEARGEGGAGSGDGARHTLDADAYQVLRDRLAAAGAELARRAEALNSARTEAFGTVELRLEATEQVRTDRPSLPGDIAPVGPCLLLAANPAEVREVGDVLRLVAVDGQSGPPPAGLLDDPQFVRDFGELYRYYRQTRVVRVRVADGRLLVVFRTGAGPSDVRVLGWRIAADGTCAYEGTAREEDPEPPEAVRWAAVDRSAYVPGRHPHIALTAPDGGTLTLDTTGGALTLRTGETVLREPVEDALQSLADAEAAYATAGPLILLRVRPYRESAERYYAVNTRTARAERIDALGQTCLRLPDDQGVVFPGGYALATGGTRAFALGTETDGDGGNAQPRWELERLVRSANGEDVLYVFHAQGDGRRLLLPYNLVRKEADAPLHVQGSALFPDGTLMVLRPADGAEPGRVHTLQRWRTPFEADTFAAARPPSDHPLARIGNPDLVAAVSDAFALARAARRTEPAAAVYEALTSDAERVLDRHHWLSDPAAGGLAEPLAEVRDTARQVLAEYARVRELTQRARQRVDEAEARITALGRRVRGEAAASAEEWVARLTELRRAQGHLVTLRDTRYADADRLDALDALLVRELGHAADKAAAHFADPRAFDGYRQRVEEVTARVADLATAADADPLAAVLDEQAEGLGTVTGTAATLEIADATVRTRVLELAADVLGAVNQARARLAARRRELRGAETAAGFAAESALLAQSVGAALAAADTPEACEEHLGRLLAQVENLATRFAGDAERLAALDVRREEIQQALTARKQALVDERALRVQRLAASATRILDGVRRRAGTLASADDLHTFFASDPMAAEHRRIAEELRGLGDPARAAELDAALDAARAAAGRSLRDRADLYEDGGATLRLGRHRLPVNTQPLDLALVPHGDALAFTITGTDYLAPVTDPAFAPTRPFWTRPLPSESPTLYRAEYLAGCLLLDTTAPPAAAGSAGGSAGGGPAAPGAARGGVGVGGSTDGGAPGRAGSGAAGSGPADGWRGSGASGPGGTAGGAGFAAAGGVGPGPAAADPAVAEGLVRPAAAESAQDATAGGPDGSRVPGVAADSGGIGRSVPGGAPGRAGSGAAGSGPADGWRGSGASGPGGAGFAAAGGVGPGLAVAELAVAEAVVRGAVAERGAEGYERGVHDHDAALILAALARLVPEAGLLRHAAAARAAAQVFWAHGTGPEDRAAWTTRARSLTRARGVFGAAAEGALAALAAELGAAAGAFLAASGLVGLADAGLAGDPRAALGAPEDPPYGGAEALDPASSARLAAGRPWDGYRGRAVPAPASSARLAAAGVGDGYGGSGAFEPSLPGGSAAGAPGARYSGGGEAPATGAGRYDGGCREVGEYLVAELGEERGGFAGGPGARALRGRFAEALGGTEAVPFKEVVAELDALGRDLAARWQLALAWLGGFEADPGDRAEAAAALVCGNEIARYEVDAEVAVTVTGLLGDHPRLDHGLLELRLDELLGRVRRFRTWEVPAYRAYQRHRSALVAAERERLALERHRARPPAGFVRNRLLDEVYLPLVGDSLAKQFGPAGGLLMLMSPPGYGKTSLVEYVAGSLGLALVSVSGPALGTATTSLDPGRAPDAAARRELEKVELALRMGSNVLLHLDDIQHTSPELLQKFIPLCDAQRRIEGAHGPYDLRGKRFAMCMAGNPYTESGGLFRVPDMLANRADVWNLGDVLSGREELFAFSYVENALTANPVLAPLAARDRADLELLVRMAGGDAVDASARPEDLLHPYPAAEREEILAVLRHLLRARATLLTVNAEYIASAARHASARTEPPFLLQGSYRTMARIAARITPTMNTAELDAAVADLYRAEAQTLASGAEAALLRLAELRGILTAEQAARWEQVKSAYRAA